MEGFRFLHLGKLSLAGLKGAGDLRSPTTLLGAECPDPDTYELPASPKTDAANKGALGQNSPVCFCPQIPLPTQQQ